MDTITKQKVRLAAKLLQNRWQNYRAKIPHQVSGNPISTTKRADVIWSEEQHLITGYGQRIVCLINPDSESSVKILHRLVSQRRQQLLAPGGPIVTKRGTRRRWYQTKRKIPAAPESELPAHMTTTQLEIESVFRRKNPGILHRMWWGNDDSLTKEQLVLLHLSGVLTNARRIQINSTQIPIKDKPQSYQIQLRSQRKFRLSNRLLNVWESFRWNVMSLNLWLGSGGK